MSASVLKKKKKEIQTQKGSNERLVILTHTHCVQNFREPTIFQAPNKLKTKPRQLEMSFSFIFHRFWPFICCLSVVLGLDKGDFPENLHTVFPC